MLLYGHKKSVESFLVILFPEALVNPLNENKQATPTPNMKCHQTEQPTRDALRRDIHIPKGVYCLLVLGLWNFAGFPFTKTSANKRFFNMSAKPSTDVQTSLRWVSRCKGTIFFWIAQKKSPKKRFLVYPILIPCFLELFSRFCEGHELCGYCAVIVR